MPAAIYDWNDWFNRARFVLRKGEDYHCPQSSMAQQVRNQAARRGVAVKVEDQGDQITVTVLGRGDRQ